MIAGCPPKHRDPQWPSINCAGKSLTNSCKQLREVTHVGAQLAHDAPVQCSEDRSGG